MNQLPASTQPNFNHYDDEIDLKQLILNLWAQKWLIIATAVICALASLAYVIVATPFFQSTAMVRPASSATFAPINATNILDLSSKTAFLKLQARMENRSTRRGFFENNPKLFAYYLEEASTTEAFDRFLKDDISIELPNDGSDQGSTFMRMAYEYPVDIDGNAVINGYYEFAETLEKNAFINEYISIKNSKIQTLKQKLTVLETQLKEQTQVELAKLKENDSARLKELQDKIDAIKTEQRTLRDNRITTLQEAYAIAKKLNLKMPKTISSFANRDLVSDGGAGSFIAEINSGGLPLYLMGTEILNAEIQVLKARKDDSFSDSRIASLIREIDELKASNKAERLRKRLQISEFIPEIDSINTELFRLSKLPNDFPNLKMAELVDKAYTSTQPVKPKKVLTLALGIILGTMLGVLIALVRIAFK